MSSKEILGMLCSGEGALRVGNMPRVYDRPGVNATGYSNRSFSDFGKILHKKR